MRNTLHGFLLSTAKPRAHQPGKMSLRIALRLLAVESTDRILSVVITSSLLVGRGHGLPSYLSCRLFSVKCHKVASHVCLCPWARIRDSVVKPVGRATTREYLRLGRHLLLPHAPHAPHRGTAQLPELVPSRTVKRVVSVCYWVLGQHRLV